MHVAWGKFSQKTQRWLKTGWLITGALVALHLGVVMPRNIGRGISQQKATGLAAVAGETWRPIARWRASAVVSGEPVLSASVLGDSPGGSERTKLAAYLEAPVPQESDFSSRKLIRNFSLSLVVKSPADTSDKIRTLAEGAGGFLVSSETAGGPEAASASLTIRVPVDRFEEIRAAIRKLGLRVDGEKLDAQDVTRQYVDQEARLRNLRAEELQYLGILKRASTVKDTLEVTDKLSEVRGQIEQQQAEFNALSKQVETVAIAVSLYREADVRVFGLNWRPLYQLKMSARDGVLALGDYVASMTAFLFYLPSVLLWLGTIMAGAAIAWRMLKWIGRVFFSFPKASIPAEGTN